MTTHDPELPSLQQFEKKLKKQQKQASAAGNASGMAIRLGAEFASGVLVGVGIGMLLDHWLGTRPVMLIICLCFGTAAGVKTMMSSVRQFEHQQQADSEKDTNT